MSDGTTNVPDDPQPPNGAEPTDGTKPADGAEPTDGTKPAGAAEPTGTPQFIGNYQLVRLLGSGAMGEVYLARHRRFSNRQYAIKLIREDIASESARKRFEREILAMGGLVHPNLVYANDAGDENGRMYLVMEYVPGKDLQYLIDNHGPFRPSQTAEIVRQICAGLSHAHQQGVVHRDIKPANVLLSNDLEVKVLDLGIASLQSDAASRMTGGGSVMGTASFIAPELWDDATNASPASDVYAIGCTAYSLCTGSPPFSGDQHRSLVNMMRAHQQKDATPLHLLRDDVSEELSMVVLRSLHKDPRRRYQDADEFIERITPYCEALTADVIPSSAAESLATILPGVTPESIRDTTSTSTSTKVEEEFAVGKGAWIASLVMLLIAGFSLTMAYLGEFVTPTWRIVFGHLGIPQNNAWLGLTTDSLRILFAIPLACYALARYYASELKRTFDVREWTAQVVLARVALVATAAFLCWRAYVEYWTLGELPSRLAEAASRLELTTQPSDEAGSTRWYFGYAAVTQGVVPWLTLAFPFVWFVVSDVNKIRRQTASLIDRQRETSYPGRMSENLRRFANSLRSMFGRMLATFFVAALVLQFNYWLGVVSSGGLLQVTLIHHSMQTAIALAGLLVAASCIIGLAYQRGFEVTSRMISDCGSITDEDDLSKIGAGWLLKKSLLDRLSGIGCLSIILLFSHSVYALNRDPEPVAMARSVDLAEAARTPDKDPKVKTTIPERVDVELDPTPESPAASESGLTTEPMVDPQHRETPPERPPERPPESTTPVRPEPQVIEATWVPERCVAAPEAELVTVEVRGFAQTLYSRLLLEPNFSSTTLSGGNLSGKNSGPAPSTVADLESDWITFLLVPQISLQTPDSYYIMQSKVSAEMFERFAQAFPGEVDAKGRQRREKFASDGHPTAFNMTGVEAIRFASLVCRGMLPTPEQWDTAFGRYYDQELALKATSGVSLPQPSVEADGDVSPWGCLHMGSGGYEFTRFDATWKMLIPHNNDPHSLQLRGWSRYEDEPFGLADWQDAGIPDDVLFGFRPIDEPSEEIGFRVVLNQSD